MRAVTSGASPTGPAVGLATGPKRQRAIENDQCFSRGFRKSNPSIYFLSFPQTLVSRLGFFFGATFTYTELLFLRISVPKEIIICNPSTTG